MTQHDDLDRQLTAWLDDPYTPPAPRYLGEVLEQTRRTRQRPSWASLERWIPMTAITRPALSPPLRVAWLLLLGLLTVAVAASVAIVGSRVLTSTGPDTGLAATVVIPQGPDAVLAFDSYGDIYTIRADGTDLRQLTGGPGFESVPTWSPDGTRIAYRLWQDESDSITVMDAGGGNRTTLAMTAHTRQDCVPEGGLGLTAWSPDGTSFIYPTSAACDGRYDLFIVPTDGSSPATRLLAPGLHSMSAAWSRDGTRIAFQGREATGSPGLYVADVAAADALEGGLEARRISDPGEYSDDSWTRPAWSADGREVAAAAGTNDSCIGYSAGTMDAFVVKADGSGQRAVAAETAKEWNPTWSPGGQRLAFQRTVDISEWVNYRPCTMATWVVDTDGTNGSRLEGLATDDTQPPFWSPDGTRLVGNRVEVIEGDENFLLYIVTVDGSSPLVTVDDIGIEPIVATWQPVAAPLPPAPSFVPASPAP
jgi:Tol biopolymer transport system component